MTTSEQPNSATIVFRGNIKKLAAILQYYIDQGVQPRSRSELLRQCIEDFHEILVQAKLLCEVKTVEEALSVFRKAGFVEPTAGGQYRSRLLEAIKQENVSIEKTEIKLEVKQENQAAFNQALNLLRTEDGKHETEI
jgi:hypothetical protein